MLTNAVLLRIFQEYRLGCSSFGSCWSPDRLFTTATAMLLSTALLAMEHDGFCRACLPWTDFQAPYGAESVTGVVNM